MQVFGPHKKIFPRVGRGPGRVLEIRTRVAYLLLAGSFGKVSFGSQPALKGAAVAAVNLNMWQALGMSDMYQLQAGPGLEIRIDARMGPNWKKEIGQDLH